MKTKIMNPLTTAFKITPKIKVTRLISQADSSLSEFYQSNSYCDSVVCMALACLYALQTTSVHASDELANGALGDLPNNHALTCIRASVSSWTVCGHTWWHRMHQYSTSHWSLIGFRSGKREGESLAMVRVAVAQ